MDISFINFGKDGYNLNYTKCTFKDTNDMMDNNDLISSYSWYKVSVNYIRFIIK